MSSNLLGIELVGSMYVGKFSLCTTFCQNSFSETQLQHHNMVYEEFRKLVKIEPTKEQQQQYQQNKNKHKKLEDENDTMKSDFCLYIGYDYHGTSSSEEYFGAQLKFTGRNAIMCVYDITKRETLTALDTILDTAQKAIVSMADQTFTTSIIFVGTHLDRDAERQVSLAEAQQLCKKWNGIGTVEVSCKHAISDTKAMKAVQDAFMDVARHYCINSIWKLGAHADSTKNSNNKKDCIVM